MAACVAVVVTAVAGAPPKTLRQWGFPTGIFATGPNNAITDVPGVTVGHVTLIEGDSVRTGVTAIVPHQGDIFRKKVPAAIHVGNGFGKLAGVTQVRELGNIETPVVLTNTLSVAAGIEGVVRYTLMQPGHEGVRSVNAVVGETNDGRLNDIRGMHVTPQMVIDAINNAHGGPVEQGNVGAGTGTICFGFKGGIGSSSRVLPQSLGGYTVGVLAQTNYGGILEIDGVQVGQRLNKHDFIDHVKKVENLDGSCMMVVITDSPLDSRNLERLAKRAMMGLAKTGGIASNGSGDYVIAMSVAPGNLIDADAKAITSTVLANGEMSPLFAATIEATAEALWNSLFMAEPMTGRNGNHVDALPVGQVLDMLRNRSPVRVGIAWQRSADNYRRAMMAIRAAGGEPVLLDQMRPVGFEYDSTGISDRYVDRDGMLLQPYADIVKRDTYHGTAADEVMQGVDAVVFLGGGDVSSTLFAQPQPWHAIAGEGRADATRDVSEYLTMAYCLDHDVPVLGLCRGMQMLGIVSGAPLIQDLDTYYRTMGKTYHHLHRMPRDAQGNRYYTPHDVTVTDRHSLLYSITLADTIRDVPSWHHQVLGDVTGTPLRVTAVTPTDGVDIIEAIERTDKRFALGVQFHPEEAVRKHLDHKPDATRFMPLDEALAYFKALIRAAR